MADVFRLLPLLSFLIAAVARADTPPRSCIAASAGCGDYVCGVGDCATLGKLELRIAPLRDGARLTIADASGARLDAVDVAASQLKRAVVIRLPHGDYRVTVASPHFVSTTRQVRVGDAPQRLSLELAPVPVISGRVIAHATGRPVAGALVSDATHKALTDAAGTFRLEIDPEAWPTALDFDAAGYVRGAARVPPARASATLDDVALSRGGSIVVEAADSVTSLELLPLDERRAPAKPISASRRRFSDIEPGRYAVIAKGSEPLERFGQVIDLAEGEARTVRLDISPFTKRVRTRSDGEPLANARVEVASSGGRWRGAFTTNGDGETNVTMWQSGRVVTTVRGADFTAPHVVPEDIAADDGDWTIDVPAQTIEGVVVDDKTSAPIANARLSLRVTAGGNGIGLALSATTDSSGAFRFRPAPYGNHALRAVAVGYLPAATTYAFVEPQKTHQLRMTLEKTESARVTVIDAAGNPVAGAAVVEYEGLQPTRIYGTTTADGIAEMPRRAGGAVEYVISREGSFAIGQLPPDAAETTVRVPRGTCRIVLRAESSDHEPIAHIWIVARYNGQMLPPDLLRDFARLQGARISSGSDGRIVLEHMPAGVYEFWPAATAELSTIAAGGGGAAPVKLVAVPGENVATMTFVAK